MRSILTKIKLVDGIESGGEGGYFRSGGVESSLRRLAVELRAE